MKAYRLHTFDGPDALRLDEVPSRPPEHGEALVRIKAASLNYRDLLISKGVYNPRMALPRIPLSDAAGEVLAVGPGVERYKAGDRVAANFMPGWVDGPLDDDKARSALGGEIEGVLAQEAVFPAAGLVRVPEFLSYEEAATLPCAALTAWNALIGGGLKSGEVVLTQGTGGVSIFALQFARNMGARVIATSSHDVKLERLKAMGASEVINYKTTPEWDRRVLELTSGVGVDHVVEVGGAGTLTRSLKSVRRGGHIALIGVLAGLGEVNPMPILMRGVRVQGIFVGSQRMFVDMCRAIAATEIHPVIDRVFEFDQAIQALRHLESGNHFGKVVIRVG